VWRKYRVHHVFTGAIVETPDVFLPGDTRNLPSDEANPFRSPPAP
jgi:hypothetical protein